MGLNELREDAQGRSAVEQVADVTATFAGEGEGNRTSRGAEDPTGTSN